MFKESLLFEQYFVEVGVESVEKVKRSIEMEEIEINEKRIYQNSERS